MIIDEEYGLPFVSITIVFRGKELELKKILLDTGSASTLLNADLVRAVDIVPEENDIVETIRGVGGIEYVYTKTLDGIKFDGQLLPHFQVEIGSMDYGLNMDGILGYDFMQRADLIIDIRQKSAVIRNDERYAADGPLCCRPNRHTAPKLSPPTPAFACAGRRLPRS